MSDLPDPNTYKTYYGWYDPTPKTLTELKARRAVVQFTNKHGYEPDEILVDGDFAQELATFTAVEVHERAGVPKNTFYLGPIRREIPEDVNP